MRDFLIKNKKYVSWAIFSILFVTLGIPTIINYGFMMWHMPGVKGGVSGWLSFLGSYLGGIFGGVIGAMVAVFVAQYTIKKQHEREREQKILEIGLKKLPSLHKLKVQLFSIDLKINDLQKQCELGIEINDLKYLDPNIKIDYVVDHSPSATFDIDFINDLEGYDAILNIKRTNEVAEIHRIVKEIHEAFQIDLQEILQRIKKLSQTLNVTPNDEVLIKELKELTKQRDEELAKRKRVFQILYKGDFKSRLSTVREEIRKQIGELETIQEKYFS